MTLESVLIDGYYGYSHWLMTLESALIHGYYGYSRWLTTSLRNCTLVTFLLASVTCWLMTLKSSRDGLGQWHTSSCWLMTGAFIVLGCGEVRLLVAALVDAQVRLGCWPVRARLTLPLLQITGLESLYSKTFNLPVLHSHCYKSPKSLYRKPSIYDQSPVLHSHCYKSQARNHCTVKPPIYDQSPVLHSHCYNHRPEITVQ